MSEQVGWRKGAGVGLGCFRLYKFRRRGIWWTFQVNDELINRMKWTEKSNAKNHANKTNQTTAEHRFSNVAAKRRKRHKEFK